MNSRPKDEGFGGQVMLPPQVNGNRLINTDVREQQGAPYQNPASSPPYGQAGINPGQAKQAGRRRRRRWPWIVGSIFVILILLAALVQFVILGFTYHPGPFTTTTRHFSTGARPTLIINDDIGDIVVRRGSMSNGVTIAETRSSTLFGNSYNNVQVAYHQSNGGNTITVDLSRHDGISFFNSPAVDFDISAPATANLELESSTGNVSVNGISGQMSLQSSTGSVSASQVNLTGSSTLKASTGPVAFSGTIDTNGTYQFQSSTGSVNVTLPRSASFHLNAQSDTGSFHSDFAGIHTQDVTVGSQASGDIGQSPAATVSLTTSTGSINLNAQP